MIPQVRCGCGAQISSWESAPAKAPGALYIYVTCPNCHAKTNVEFSEISPNNWTVRYSYQPYAFVSPTQTDA